MDSQNPKIVSQSPQLSIISHKSIPRYLKVILRSTKCTPKDPNRVPEAKYQPAEAKTGLLET